MPPSLTLVECDDPLVIVHTCLGDYRAPRQEAQLLKNLESSPPRDVEIHVCGLIDSLGAHFLVFATKIVTAKGRRVTVVYCDNKTLTTLRILGLHHIVTLVQSPG
jgi:anti-anti-sigma regulatory factor